MGGWYKPEPIGRYQTWENYESSKEGRLWLKVTRNHWKVLAKEQPNQKNILEQAFWVQEGKWTSGDEDIWQGDKMRDSQNTLRLRVMAE